MPETQANFFKSRREELNLTQWDLAIAVGVKTSAVSQWENEVNCPRLEQVEKLAAALRVAKTQLLTEMELMNSRIMERRSKLSKAVRARRPLKPVAAGK